MLFNLNIPDSGTATVNGQNILGVAQRKIRDMGVSLIPVSYTHLDVYKRQLLMLTGKGMNFYYRIF